MSEERSSPRRSENEYTPPEAPPLVGEIVASRVVAFLEDLGRFYVFGVRGEPVGHVEPLARLITIPVVEAGEYHLDEFHTGDLEAVESSYKVGETLTGLVFLPDMRRRRHGPIAVSYTHLDVYKRQDFDADGRFAAVAGAV